ncbi:sensor histidine kinase [Tellurirhabdus bombi]|uniref:sensor histidine kinase n=1 Tax=Tellurirhabdus bombi TaxID=2907205 RepID=UPI001F396A6F|nr:sensor histidine kinase [Tellurirhabdus bombi]
MNVFRRGGQNPVRRRIRYGFGTALGLIALGFVLTLNSYSENGEDRARVERSYEVSNQLGRILLMLVDVENTVRGYVATNDTIFLETHRAAVTQVPVILDSLQSLLKDDSMQLRNLDSLRLLTKDNLEIVSRQQKAMRARTAISIMKTYMLIGKIRMDRIRVLINTMQQQEHHRMDELTEAATKSFRTTVIITFLLSLLTFITLIVCYNLLESELNTRQKTEDQLRAYEEDLKEKINLLEMSNEELERFAFVASHDMQEPLRKIQSFGFLIRDKYEPALGEDGGIFLGKILQSAERMSKMIKDLLNFSRISNKQEPFQPVDLNDVFGGILSDQELKIKTIGADMVIGRMPVVDAVSNQMTHLFTNLISNALKFSKSDEKPVVSIQAEAVSGEVYEDLIPEKTYYRILIKDNGIGFDEKYLDHIFKIFQRLHGKSTYEGTGIGLAICKRIVSYHKGLITAHSQPGSGATFIVVLPEHQNQSKHGTTTIHETHSHLVGG